MQLVLIRMARRSEYKDVQCVLQLQWSIRVVCVWRMRTVWLRLHLLQRRLCRSKRRSAIATCTTATATGRASRPSGLAAFAPSSPSPSLQAALMRSNATYA